MSWQDELQQASFRDETFYIERHEAQGGRRVASHEYPARDKPYTEDLGRKQRRYTLQAFVIGGNYIQSRNALMRALEQRGPGILVHPYLGRLSVNIDSYNLSESTEKGGLATFTIQCVESNDKPAPSAAVNTQAVLQNACKKLDEANIEAFEKRFKVKNQLQAVIKKVEDKLAAIASELDEKQRELIALVAAPKDLAQRLINRVANLAASLKSTAQTLERLVKKPVRWPLVQTEAAQSSQSNDYALDTLMTIATISYLAASAAETEWQASSDAKAFHTQLFSVIDEVISAPSPNRQPIEDELYIALMNVQAALLEDIETRSLQLPNVSRIELPSTLPSLVVCFNQYGELSQENTLILRNKIAKPGFMPAHTPLEVLL